MVVAAKPGCFRELAPRKPEGPSNPAFDEGHAAHVAIRFHLLGHEAHSTNGRRTRVLRRQALGETFLNLAFKVIPHLHEEFRV